MRTVVLLVKNGIGYGHLRRAVLLAEAVRRAGRLRPVIVSQATTLDLLKDRTVQVVNLPLLQRVPSDVLEDAYTVLLERLLTRLDPAIVIEDTYPDPRYLSLSALAGRPRLLVMRRLDGESFDKLRATGRLAAYDRILVAQRPEEFHDEGHSADALAAVLHSGKFAFVGNLSHEVDRDAVAAVGRRYAPTGAPLVVVNGGAGGDQLADGYGDRLFAAATSVADRLRRSDHSAHFVLVTGPYYAGRMLQEAPNVTVRSFEPQLAELLAAAHVAIIKPGNNVLSETLQGGAHAIMVPDASFLEGLDGHARRTAGRYGGTVAPADPDVLERLVSQALDELPRNCRLRPNRSGIAKAVATVESLAQTPSGRVRERQMLLVLRPGPRWTPTMVHELLPDGASGPTVLGLADGDGPVAVSGPRLASSRKAIALLLDGTRPDVAPEALAGQGVRVLITSSSEEGTQVRRWLRRSPPTVSQTVVPATRLVAAPGQFERLSRQLAQVIESAEPSCAVVDLSEHQEKDALSLTLRELCVWLAEQPVELVGPSVLDARYVQRLLEAA